MKKVYVLLISSIICLSITAQAPDKMSYQAVIRNATNNLIVSSPVGMQISIIQGSPSGTSVYVESQTPTTNTNGLASIEIGGGTVVSGSFSGIDWSNGPYFIKTETDPTGGTTYSITGTSQLLSTPYALYANSSGNNIADVLNMGNNAGGQKIINLDTIGIGISNPTTAKLVINGMGGQGIDLSTYDSYANMRVIQNTNNATDHDIYIGHLSGTTSSLHLYSNNGETMTVKNGNTGIGNTNPSEKLEVSGNINMVGFLKFQGTNTIYGNPNDIYGNIRVLQNNSATLQDGMYINLNSSGSGTQHLRLYAGAGSPRIYIDASTGYVGIGTVTPARSLHINSTLRLEPTGSAPSSPSEGDIYMNSITHKLMVYDGTLWQACW